MYRAFALAFVTTTVITVALIVGLGRAVDPFGHFSPGYTTYPDLTVDPKERLHQSAFLLNRALFKLVNFEKYADQARAAGTPLHLVVGDSLGREIDPRKLARYDGKPWYSLAYGGATMSEMLALVDGLLAHHEVEEIIWMLPFTRFSEIAEKNLMPGALTAARHPYRHLLTFEHVRAVFYTLRHRWLGVPFHSDIDPRRVEPDPRDAATMVNQLAAGWSDDWFATIDRLIARAEAAGIRVVLVKPPVSPDLRRRFEVEVPAEYAAYRAFVERHCLIDAAALRPDGWPAELFIDVHHLMSAAFADFNHALSEALPTACRRNGPPPAKHPAAENLAASTSSIDGKAP